MLEVNSAVHAAFTTAMGAYGIYKFLGSKETSEEEEGKEEEADGKTICLRDVLAFTLGCAFSLLRFIPAMCACCVCVCCVCLCSVFICVCACGESVCKCACVFPHSCDVCVRVSVPLFLPHRLF